MKKLAALVVVVFCFCFLFHSNSANADNGRPIEHIIVLGWSVEEIPDWYLADKIAEASEEIGNGQPAVLYLAVGDYELPPDLLLSKLDSLKSILARAGQAGVPLWLEIREPRKKTPAKKILKNQAGEREAWLGQVKTITRVYTDQANPYALVVGDYRVTLFDEAPHHREFWRPGNWRAIAQIFDLARNAIKQVGPEIRVGIFLSGATWRKKSTATKLMPALAELGGYPDFNFVDRYEVSRAGVIKTVKTLERAYASNFRPTYYLGPMHTTKSGRTPSKAEIVRLVNAVSEAPLAGIGFFHANIRKSKKRAFVPNDRPQTGQPLGRYVYTTSNDRWQFSRQTVREKLNPGSSPDKFDLIVLGWGFKHAGHRLLVFDWQTLDWRHLRTFNPHFDWTRYNSNDKYAAMMTRGISKKYLTADSLFLKITGLKAEEPAMVFRVFMRQHEAGQENFLTEPEMLARITAAGLPDELTLGGLDVDQAPDEHGEIELVVQLNH